MTLQPFNYIPADSLQTAEALLREHGERAAVLAGGTDLLGALKDAIHDDPPKLVIGLKPVTALRYVKAKPSGVRIGALTTFERDRQAPGDPPDLSAPRRSRGQRRLAADSQRRDDRGQSLPGAALLVLPQPRQHLRLSAQGRQVVRRAVRREPLPLDLRRHVRQRRAVRGRLSHPQRHPRVHGRSSAPAELEEAVAILLRTNPLAAIMGRACAHYCEEECNRFDFDEPVSIRDVERTLGDYALEHAEAFYRAPEVESGKTVAVVGAGPAGLTAAYFLRQQGHAVTVYDRMPEAGGMLTYSIPAYRLPKAVVQEQIKALEGMGIRFELGANVGDDGLTLDDLRARYQSVFLATGLWNGKSLRLERGELLDSGLEFLIDLQRGVERPVGERVLVIGGGSVAVDVAITARRSGARQVAMACLESLETMPAIPEDIEQAHEEGITILPSWGPQRVVERDGKLAGMAFVRCTSVFDKDGRFAPAFDPAVTTVFEADQVLVAIGQAADLAYAGPALRTERGMIVIDGMTGATSLEGVFAGGDVTGDRATVVQAMAAGQRAAASIDAYLTGAQVRRRAPAPRARSR